MAPRRIDDDDVIMHVPVPFALLLELTLFGSVIEVVSDHLGQYEYTPAVE